MSGQPKKVSLFKQKINLARSKMEVQDSGFPIAPRIIGYKTQMIKEEDKSTEYIKEEVKVSSGFLHTFKGISKNEEEEMGKIQSENWKAVNSMSQTQRQEAIASLRSQLPDTFLKILQKGQKEPPKVQQSELKQSKDELNPSKDELNPNNKGEQPEDSEAQGWLSMLKLNIDKDSLEYTEEETQNLVDLKRLGSIIGSQNNQSQVVGGKLLEKWAKALSALMTTKTRELIIVNGVPLHGNFVGSYLLEMFKLGLKQASLTTYRSVFIQLCSSLSSTLTEMMLLLKKEPKIYISAALEGLISRIRGFDIPTTDAVNIKDSLTLVISSLSKDEEQFGIQWSSLKDSVDAIIELSLLEVSHKDGYWFKAYETAGKCGDLEQLLNLLQFLYEFINRLIIKRNKQAYIDLNQQRDQWSLSISVLLSKFCQSSWNVDSEYVFQAIFLARFIGGQSWQSITQTSHLPGEKGLLINGFLLFNTLPDLKASSLSQEQSLALNHVFEWISLDLSRPKAKIDPNYIMLTFLELFLQEEQYYSELNQETLQKLVTKLVTHPKLTFEKVVSLQQVRTLTKNYNYSSFGNSAFACLLLSIALSCSPEKEALILRQSLLPCWKQFYDGVNQKQEFPKMRSDRSNEDLKEEILLKIEREEPNSKRENYFIQYLS